MHAEGVACTRVEAAAQPVAACPAGRAVAAVAAGRLVIQEGAVRDTGGCPGNGEGKVDNAAAPTVAAPAADRAAATSAADGPVLEEQVGVDARGRAVVVVDSTSQAAAAVTT